MNVAIRSMMTGISEASQDAGRHPGWPSDKIAEEVIAQLAEDWQGPARLPEGQILSKQAALEIEDVLIKAAEHIRTQQGLAPAPRAKTASEDDLLSRASAAAAYWMKVADAGSLTSHGPNSLDDAARTDQLSELERRQRPDGYAMQQPGAASTIPEPAVTGPRETAPPTGFSVSPAVNNSLTQHSAKAASIAARALGKRAADEDGDGQEDPAPPADANPGMPDSASPEGGAAPGQPSEMEMLQQILATLQQLAPPSDDAAAATAGLAAHPDGMDVLAHVATTAKTGAQADAMLREVLTANPGLRKIASLDDYEYVKAAYKQGAAGSLTPTTPNSLASAASTDQLSELERKQRPDGYAHHTEPGKTNLPAPAPTGAIMPAPRDGVPQVSASNVVTRADKQAADDEHFIIALSKIATEYGPAVPMTASEDQKLAAFQTLLATAPSRREAKLAELFPR